MVPILNEKERNAFDLLRLLLACGVILAHTLFLGGYSSSDFLSQISKGQANLADTFVMGFFALSGYLITASFNHARFKLSFVTHRLLRILPGYWVCLLITGFGFAYLIATLGNNNTNSFTFIGTASSLSYFFKNFFLKINQWSVGNILNSNAYKGSLNGSLWSLYPEMQCYLLTFILGLFGLFKRNQIIVLLLFLFALVVFAAKESFKIDIGPTFLYLSNALKLYVCYLAGTVYFLYRDRLPNDKRVLLFTTFFTLSLLKFGGFQLISPILLSYLLLTAFQLFSVKLKYDLSYGIYIYGFPVQQCLFLIVGNRIPFIIFALLAVSIAAVLSFLSFVCIERPFIRLKKPIDDHIAKYFKSPVSDT